MAVGMVNKLRTNESEVSTFQGFSHADHQEQCNPPGFPDFGLTVLVWGIINFFCICDPGLRKNCMACVWSHSLHDYDLQ